MKFREVKSRCRQIVENYRKIRKDDREFPEFFLHALAEDGSREKCISTGKQGEDPNTFQEHQSTMRAFLNSRSF